MRDVLAELGRFAARLHRRSAADDDLPRRDHRRSDSALLDVPFAFLFGIFTGLVAIVPFFGTLLSTTLPALFVLNGKGYFGFSPVGHALLVVGLGVVVHLIEGNLVSPLVMSKKVDLPPVLTIMAVLVMGQLLGGLGLVVALPTLAALMVIVRRILITPDLRGAGLPPNDARAAAAAPRARRRAAACSRPPAPRRTSSRSRRARGGGRARSLACDRWTGERELRARDDVRKAAVMVGETSRAIDRRANGARSLPGSPSDSSRVAGRAWRARTRSPTWISPSPRANRWRSWDRADAGKTTLLLCAAGLMAPDAGMVSWFGRFAIAPPSLRRARLHYCRSSLDEPCPADAALIHLIDVGDAEAARLGAWIAAASRSRRRRLDGAARLSAGVSPGGARRGASRGPSRGARGGAARRRARVSLTAPSDMPSIHAPARVGSRCVRLILSPPTLRVHRRRGRPRRGTATREFRLFNTLTRHDRAVRPGRRRDGAHL